MIIVVANPYMEKEKLIAAVKRLQFRLATHEEIAKLGTPIFRLFSIGGDTYYITPGGYVFSTSLNGADWPVQHISLTSEKRLIRYVEQEEKTRLKTIQKQKEEREQRKQEDEQRKDGRRHDFIFKVIPVIQEVIEYAGGYGDFFDAAEKSTWFCNRLREMIDDYAKQNSIDIQEIETLKVS